MRRIRLTVAYDGTAYCGSQTQPNGKTIEEELNKAIRALTGEKASVILASRTDSGVHAEGNAAVFDTEMKMAADKFTFALNDRLPEDIRIRNSDEVSPDWHPRKQNCIKTYEYRIFNAKTPDPLMRLYSHFCYYDLDIEKMREASGYLIGEHDFKSFCTPRTDTGSTVRTVTDVRTEQQNSCIVITIKGNGFLYNMVRIIAGTLMQVGTGMRTPEEMKKILRAKDRKKAGPCAAAAGLTLMGIEFETENRPVISAENEEWSYVLDQHEMDKTGEAYLIIRRCTDAEYRDLLTRSLHQAWRNGAKEILVADTEHPERLQEGQIFGFYTLIGRRKEERKEGEVDISSWLTTGYLKGKDEIEEIDRKEG